MMDVLTILSAIAYLCIIGALYAKSRTIFWLLMPFNVYHCWMIVSNWVIEHGAYMTELGEFGTMVGSTLAYSIYALFQNLIVAILVSAMIGAKWNLKQNSARKLQTGLGFVAILALTLSVFALHNGSPVFSGTDRFSYLDNVGFLPKKVYLLHFASGFIAGVCSVRRKMRRWAIGSLLLWLVAVVLMGDKFSAIFATVLAFVCGRMAYESVNRSAGVVIREKCGAKYYLVALCVLAVVPIFGYNKYHHIDSEDGIKEMLFRRILVDQGAVWHGTFRRALSNSPQYNVAEVLGEDTLDTPSGINALMYVVADYRFARASREAGISFTMGYPAITVYVFGPFIGICIGLASCMMIAANIFVIVECLRSGSLAFLFVATNCLYVLIDVFLVGRTWKLVGWQMSPLIVLCMIVVIMRVCREKRRHFI